mgnify:CR=1 FL=1
MLPGERKEAMNEPDRRQQLNREEQLLKKILYEAGEGRRV